MKTPLYILPVTLFLLAETAVGLAGHSPNPVSFQPFSASGLQSVETKGSERMLSSNSAQVAGSNISDTTPVKKVALLVLDPGGSDGSAPVKMGFLVELEPGWHIYWANPGDAGLAPRVRWTLLPGFTAGPLQHPVPRKSVEAGIVSLEHDGPTLLICDIAPPPSMRPADRWEAAAVLEWMACRESCIVGETAVRTVYPPDATALKEGRSLLDRFASRFPRPLSEAGLSAGAAQAIFAGGEWQVEIVLAGSHAARVDDFFPFPLEDFVIDHPKISCRGGKVNLPLIPSRGPGAQAPSAIRGLVIIDGAGYEANVPVFSRPPLASVSTHSILSWR